MVMNTGTAILNRILEPDSATLPPEAAKAILQLSFPESDHVRLAQLQAKAGDGSLTPEEREELDGYLLVADLLAIFQSKARISLKQSGLRL